MNDTSATSAPGASLLPEGTAAITTAHLTLIVVLAILVIAGILWGVRLKRTRVQAARDVRENAEESGMPPAPVSTDIGDAAEVTAPMPPTPQPIPVTPAVPPLGDAPVAGAPDAQDRLADEPIAATAAPLDASPAAEAAPPAPAAMSSFAYGPVTQLKGLGPKVATRLAELGITTVGDMAALSDGEAQALDAQLGSFTGRLARDRWVEQARLLAAGDRAGFEAVFGKL